MSVAAHKLSGGLREDDDLRVLDGEDGVGSAASVVVVSCCGDTVGDAFLQKVHGLLAVWDHVLGQVWLEEQNVEKYKQGSYTFWPMVFQAFKPKFHDQTFCEISVYTWKRKIILYLN